MSLPTITRRFKVDHTRHFKGYRSNVERFWKVRNLTFSLKLGQGPLIFNKSMQIQEDECDDIQWWILKKMVIS